jgi:hypothetical protein
MLLRMVERQLERVFPGAFAQFSEERDVPSYQRLQPSADAADNRAGAHNDAADDFLGLNDAKPSSVNAVVVMVCFT